MYPSRPKTPLSVTIARVATLMTLTAATALADDLRRVRPGEEIVVSFPPANQAVAASVGGVSRLKIPGEVSIRSAKGDDKVGVFSSQIGAGILSNEPVPVDDDAVTRACTALHQANPNVRFDCEANILMHIKTTPNDPRYSELYGMRKIQAPEAWNITAGSPSVLVAVVDTGVQYTHPDLQGNIAVNTGEVPNNGVDDDANGYVDDYYGYDFSSLDSDPMDENEHGTHCAGTIGAKGNNEVGVVGVNWNVGIIPVRVLDSQGSGSLADIAKGMNYAVTRGARIVSLSLGGPSDSSALENAIANGRTKNVLFVVAAGNETSNNDQVGSFPANSPADNVLSVAATDSADRLADFSNFGATTVDVGAPGVDILSTVPGNKYEFFSGTSMATPMTAGVAALILAANPSLSWSDVKTLIMNTVDPVSSLSGKCVTGGRINANKAVAASIGATPTEPSPEPVPDPGTDPGDSNPEDDAYYLTLSWKVSGSRALISGKIVDGNSEGVPDENIYLVCNNAVKGTTVSNGRGGFKFRMNLPSRKLTCHVEDDYDGEESDDIVIQRPRRRTRAG